MDEFIKYTTPTLVKGKVPTSIPKGSTKEKELAKNIWYVNYTYNGKQYRIKEGINRIKDYKEKAEMAEALLLSIKNDLKNGYNPSDPTAYIEQFKQENISINDAVDKYMDELNSYARPKTVQSYLSKLRYLVEAFSEKPVKSFNEADIRKYIKGKIDGTQPAKIFMNNKHIVLDKPIPWTPNTVRTAKGVFRTFFHWCINKKYYVGNNPSKIESKTIRSEVAPDDRHIPFSKPDIDMIMKYMDENDKHTAFFCRFIYSTCLRPGEISKLKIKDIDFGAKQIEVPLHVTKNTKKTTTDRINIEPNLYDEIIRLGFDKLPKHYYLISHSDTIAGEIPLGSNRPYKRFVKVLKKLGLKGKGYTLYSFKHYSNIQRLNSGWGIAEIVTANRHSDVSMTDKYLKHINRITDISQKTVPSI
jgi:integrase